MNKIIEAYPEAWKICNTEPIWQWDVGDKIHLNGIDLPPSYKAEFSNVSVRGTAKPQIQTSDTIEIPPEYQESGDPVYTWIVFVDENSRQTECMIVTPVSARSKSTDEEPTHAEQSEIDQTLAALNIGVSRVEGIADAIPDTINDALEAAKESGEFDGPKGDKGDKGEKGDTGEQGPQGIQGPKGDKGDKGDKGNTGSQGPKGDVGATGPQGTKGDKGDKGDTGEQGPQGVQGPKGDKGDKGDTGSQGLKGDKGDTGDSGVYIGATAPTDSDVNVWINPNGADWESQMLDELVARTVEAVLGVYPAAEGASF